MSNPINKKTDADIAQLKNKTVYSIPDNPSNKGFSAEQIKDKMAGPVLEVAEWIKELSEQAFEIGEKVDGVDNSKVDKLTTSGQYVYAHLGSAQGELQVAATATGGSIPKRESDGRLKVATPSSDGDATTKAYVDSGLGGKVDKTSSANKVYITDDTGAQTTVGYDDYTDGVFVRRDENNQIVVPTPTAVNHAARKGYVDAFGKSVELTINSSTYVMTLKLKDAGGNTLTTQTVDLPLETMVVSGSYDSVNKKVVLTLQNGQTVEFSVADLIDGLLGYSDINITGGAITSISVNGVSYPIAESVAITTIPKVVQSTTDLPASNDGYLYLVLDNGYLYTYDADNGWEQAYQYTSDLLTITEVDGIVED